MLVLTRKVGDTLQIGDDIRLKVIRVKGSSRVSFGIETAERMDIRTAGRAPAVQKNVR
jgi:carbon storage regulator CsrA